jgi:hypothetical protein
MKVSYDEQGDFVSLEILDASRRVSDARKIEIVVREDLSRRARPSEKPGARTEEAG